MHDPNALKIYTDGSAPKQNPGGPGGIAAIVEFPDDFKRKDEEIFKEGYYKTNNQRMELLACIEALDYIRKNIKSSTIGRVIIITDSGYVYNNQNSESHWKDSDWRTKSGTQVENQDLWKKFFSLRLKTGISTQIQWQKGKSTSIMKEVDKLAKLAARRPTKTDFGFRAGKVSRSEVADKSAPILFHAQGQKMAIKIYRKQPAGKKKEYKIFFHLFSEKEKTCSGKYCAYVAPDKISELHRKHCYKVQFNNNSDYPVVKTIIKELD